MWLGRGVLELEQPFHPLGLLDAGTAADGAQAPSPATEAPSFADVVEARADRVAMVRDFLATRHPGGAGLSAQEPPRARIPRDHVVVSPHDPRGEWEHHRYAVRDLDAIGSRSSA